jgi:hypothetical protein
MVGVTILLMARGLAGDKAPPKAVLPADVSKFGVEAPTEKMLADEPRHPHHRPPRSSSIQKWSLAKSNGTRRSRTPAAPLDNPASRCCCFR